MARGDGGLYKQEDSDVFWCRYWIRGIPYRESTGERDEQAAGNFLKQRIKQKHADEIGAREFVNPKMEKIKIRELVARLKNKYELNGQDSAQNLSVLKRAEADFGDYAAVTLTADSFDQYKKDRLAKGDALATIQRVLQMIRAAYRLSVKKHKFPAHRVPFIEIQKENNVRRDCYDETEFRRIHANLPPYLADFFLFARITGMRSGEVKSLRWANVRRDVIELQAEDAKGDGSEKYARSIPMAGPDLAGILERRRAARQVKRDGTVTLAEFFFHHNAKPIVDYRKAWNSAIRKAGLRRLVPHTLP